MQANAVLCDELATLNEFNIKLSSVRTGFL